MGFKFVYISIFMFIASAAWADELATLNRLSDIVESQCRRFYGIDTNNTIQDLQQKRMSETDKLACSYPFAFKKMQARLKTLEELDPSSQWGNEAYVTLAARIYKFNYFTDAPRPGGNRTDIFAVHPNLMVLHRILRQTTPYALSFVYPRLTRRDADLVGAARAAAAGAAEITPWSATLHIAKGTDCYGPEKEKCMNNRMQALQNLLQAIQLLSKNDAHSKYVINYSNTPEATELQTAPFIKIASDIRMAMSGDPVEYILGVRTTAGWLRIRPDLRDTLDYLAASDTDLEATPQRTINIETLTCRLVYESLFALANDANENVIRQAIAPMNPMEPVVAADPKLRDDGAKKNAMLDRQDCNQLRPLSIELNMHGVLSRFQAYQTRLILTRSHSGLLDQSLNKNSRRYTLLSDVERVIHEVQDKAKESGVELKPNSSPIPQQLVDYVSKLLKENN